MFDKLEWLIVIYKSVFALCLLMRALELLLLFCNGYFSNCCGRKEQGMRLSATREVSTYVSRMLLPPAAIARRYFGYLLCR